MVEEVSFRLGAFWALFYQTFSPTVCSQLASLFYSTILKTFSMFFLVGELQTDDGFARNVRTFYAGRKFCLQKTVYQASYREHYLRPLAIITIFAFNYLNFFNLITDSFFLIFIDIILDCVNRSLHLKLQLENLLFLSRNLFYNSWIPEFIL